MQLYALDSNSHPIFSAYAQRHIDYQCPECLGVVRLRGGLHKREHFYHIEKVRECRQNGKSAEHLAIQHYLWDLFGSDNCRLEMPFPKIGRIADVVWLPNKIIFEVQCASITAKEVRERNRDYASEGYDVVWLLHDSRYNQFRMSAMEIWLFHRAHYFTDINENGEGMIYDQFSVIKEGAIRQKYQSLEVDLAIPKKWQDTQDCPAALNRRFQHGSRYFSGDLIDRYLLNNLNEEQFSLPAVFQEKWGQKIKRFIFRPYRLVFQLLLERCSK